MLYLLFVLTFLAGILFYGLSPHDKGLDMSVHQAEGMIATFLAQHQAARDYLYTWLGADDTDGTGNLQNGTKFLRAEVDGSENPTFPNFETMMPRGVVSDMCKGNNGTPGEGGKDACFVSKVVVDGAKHYVITYGGWVACTEEEKNQEINGCSPTNSYKRPDWWPRPGQKLRRFESWRRAIANRTRGSITCGTLIEIPENSGNWCIDNGESVYKNESAASPVCMKLVPSAVIDELPYDDNGKDDLLFCISEFKQGLGNYVSGINHFYDGLANTSFGQHQSANLSWRNLASTASLPATLTWTSDTAGANIHDAKWDENTPYLTLHGLLNTGIQLGNTYTLTVLLSGYGNGGAVSCDLLRTAEDDGYTNLNEVIFKKLSSSDRVDGTDAVYLKTTTDEEEASICNMNTSGNNTGIVSWTFVVKGTTLNVYENTINRFENKTIDTTNNKYLVLGNTDGGQVPFIYGIRYYSSALTPEQIQKNFKVDQKRFGIPDINNGKIGNTCVNEGSSYNNIPQVKHGGVE